MRLKSMDLKGFKSFPERTRLEFGPGVSVVVGPNGSGKSNVTDAVLWAMGEQSPLAIRGSSMQDVIFGGGRGIKARNSAEVEIVLDNSDGTVDLPLSEISILRRLDRSGEGEYRLNGARCRLGDVIEVLSDTGLGKETHSVISQGRVEAIVTSKPRDRRLLIEEAAGLGKHRKRRRRAQLKLERTQENLDRALDVEREARTRLRPLKRQAEAAELHERLERQMLEVRLELATETLRRRRVELHSAELGVQGARERRAQCERALNEVIARRGIAERALAERSEKREELARKVFGARSSHERLQLRGEQTQATLSALTRRISRAQSELQSLDEILRRAAEGQEHHDSAKRISELEAELQQLELRREEELEIELAQLRGESEAAAARAEELNLSLTSAQRERQLSDEHLEQARERLAQSEREVESARRHAASVGSELAAVNQFLRSHIDASKALSGESPEQAPRLFSEMLRIKDGYELALAAALGGRLDGALVTDIKAAQALLDRSGQDGAIALLADVQALEREPEPSGLKPTPHGSAPAPGAIALLDLISGPPAVLALAKRLLTDAWVIEHLDQLPGNFAGIAVTPSGRVWFAASGEVRQVLEGGSERVLARRNERERLISSSEQAAQAEHAARGRLEQALEHLKAAEEAGARAERELRETGRQRTEANEAKRRAQWLIEQRRNMPQQGPAAVRRAQLEGELSSERRQSERIERERSERLRRAERLRAQQALDSQLVPLAERLLGVLHLTAQSVSENLTHLEVELSRDREDGDDMAAQLRACASEEAQIQFQLRAEGETVTSAEVAAQRLRDQAADAQAELQSVSERLELEVKEDDLPAPKLEEEQLEALSARLERLGRRREQLGPVNPLAQEEYAEAIEHVEELETRRTDLESALRELRTVIRDTDRQIQETFQETFQAAAANFAELVADVFPGGSGSLRLVSEEVSPRPVLGGEPLPAGAAGEGQQGDSEEQAEQEAEIEEHSGEQLMGVEIEVTPAGKSTKRLSLLSGGEKSMTALAFVFAVFLARPCPFYILDEVEAALDDLNLDRFLTLLRRYADRAQFIVITHQKRTMEAADWLYGVSMGGDGVSKIISRRLPPEQNPEAPEGGESSSADLGAALV
jgi:chromosome segregation protein